ncbi:hypothetical protein [Vitreimonas flagellata]|uniref:hypothetical protein n=1 Tax=Vitreimonas flagellata TaxID=2560861 RepID=UPI001074D701|nr:hypothetical protein [Vitreimonas flagellata]
MKLRKLDLLNSIAALPAYMGQCFAFTDAGDGAGGGGGNDDEVDDQTSIDDDVRGAMDDILAGDDGQGDQARADQQQRDRVRDESGRFAKQQRGQGDQQQQQPKPNAQQQDPQRQQQQPNPQQQQDPQARQPGRMPDNWRPGWLKPPAGAEATLQPWLLEQLYQRESAFMKAYQPAVTVAKAWAPVEEALASVSAHLKESGASQSVQGFVTNLVKVEEWLHTDSGNEKPSLKPLQWLAEQYYGVPLHELVKGMPAPQPGGGGAPPANQEITQLRTRLEQLEGHTKQQQESARAARKAELAAQYQQFERSMQTKVPAAFVNDPATGAMVIDPEVKRLMRSCLTSDPPMARTFEEAFEKACQLHPTLSQRTQQAQRKAAGDRARAAGVSPRRTSPLAGGGDGKSKTNGISVDEDVRASLAELQQ